MQKDKYAKFRLTDELADAIAFIRREKKGGFDLSETCRTTIFRMAKKLGWKPNA